LACARAAGSTFFEGAALINLALDPELGEEEQVRLADEAVAVAHANGDPWLLAVVTLNYGNLMSLLGRTEQASDLIAQAYRFFRRVGDISFVARSANGLGWIALCVGDTVEARAKLGESLELAELVEENSAIASGTVNLGWLELIERDLDQACERFEAAAILARRQRYRSVVAEALWGFAQVAAARGDPDRAARLAGAASAVGTPAGYDPATSTTFVHDLDDARASFGENAWQRAWADGAELDLDAALKLALEP
jgi:tetratricopeptide (TPR) repeat protein